MRSRILYSNRQEVLLFTNYKVGFTSLNRHLISTQDAVDSGWSASIRTKQDVDELNRKINYKKFLFVRHPYDRLVSYYSNWIIDKNEDFEHAGNRNHAFMNMKEYFPTDVYTSLSNSSREDRSSVESFRLFLNFFTDVWHRNPHTVPQHFVYTEMGLKINDFDEVIELENMNEFLRTTLDIDLSVTNRSSRKSNSHLYIEELYKFCDFVYARDFYDFGWVLKKT